VPIERPQVDAAGGSASRTARPQEPIAGCDGRLDRRREQHRYVRGLASVPDLNQLHRILDDLWPKGTARSRFLLRSLAAPVLYFALVESHSRIVVE
jgi:hypothetical protein